MRLVAWCIAYVVGAACALEGLFGARLWPVAAGGAALAAVTAAIAHGRRRPHVAAGAALVAWWLLGAALGGRALHGARLDPVLAAALARDDAVPIEAVVVRGPEEQPAPEGAPDGDSPGARMVVALQSIAGAPATGTLALTVIHGWPDFAPGERVACDARLHELRGTRNPGLVDPTLALRAAGIDALAGVARADGIRRVGAVGGHGLRRAAFAAHRAMRAAIERALGTGPAAAFLRTAVLGERRGVGADVEAGFRAAGATHVLSVSGLHLAAVALALFLALRLVAVRIPRLPLYVDPRAVAAAGALPAIGFFTLLTGEAVATERSALMLSIGMAAHLVGRRATPAPTIAAAALVLLVWRPLQLLDVSLQLSLASVAGIAFLARPFRRQRRDGARPTGGAWRWLAGFAAATAAATAATGPLVAHCFGEVAPLSPVGNLALVPLVELGVVPVGLLGGAMGALAPTANALPLRAAGWAARAALAVAGWFGRHAPLWLCRMPNGIETAALTAAGALALLAVAARGPARRRLLAGALLGAAVASGSLLGRDLMRRQDRDLVVTFLDVGQGDAAVVEAPGGAVALIDGGGTRDGAFDTGARIVEPFLRTRGISRLDVVALSHPHPDHLNGLFRVVDRFPVGAFWSSGDDGHNPEYRRLLEAVGAHRIPAPPVGAGPLGEARLEPLGPFAGEGIGPPPGLSVNDASLVLRVAFGGRAVLFAGDLEADGEGELAGRRATGQTVAADVLKVPHHGSRTSSSVELLDAVHPALAVMSLGWRNQFHFPAPEVVARYQARGARVVRTDRDGAITVRVSADGTIAVSCQRGCPAPQPAPGAGR